MTKRAFTLIELLIVVAIIAILAAIAVPNFLEAQVRAKVSRAKADMRSVATGIESYRVDQNKYPVDGVFFWLNGQPQPPSPLYIMTTPVAYLTSIPSDPFRNRQHVVWGPGGTPQPYIYFADLSWKDLQRAVHSDWPDKGHLWVLITRGPDLVSNSGEYMLFGEELLVSLPAPTWEGIGMPCLYDATNGTLSPGDIVRLGP